MFELKPQNLILYTIHLIVLKFSIKNFTTVFPQSSIESFTFTYDQGFVYHVKLNTRKQLNAYVNNKVVEQIVVPLEYKRQKQSD